MKLLLDESVPRRLGSSFPDSFEVRTVQHMGWAGAKNGDLLRMSAEHGFDAFLTVDQGIEYQQNLVGLVLPVIIMIAHRNRLQELQLLVPEVITVLAGNLQSRIYRVPA